MPLLAEYQRDFAAALLAPAIGDDPAVAAGVRVHRNTVMKALIDAVLANYPTIGVLMGEEWLADVARAYALQHPPGRAALADYGESFPDFVRSMNLTQDWPYLPDVAELDRAWTQSLLAADALSLTPARLTGMEPSEMAGLRLRLHPAARYKVYGNSAVTVWQANRPPAAPPAELHVDGRDEVALMVRNDEGVTLLPLDVAGRAFLESIISGGSISEAAGTALQAAPDTDIAGCWSTLLGQGAFADIETQGD
ncbi:MAG: DNA-binding domain-containing protein [Steroidobacteraceae bacterium]